MKFLARFMLWATILFVPSWLAAHAYQQALAAIAGKILGLFGREIAITDMELYFPFDLGIYVALCLASSWATWRRRGSGILVGLPVLMVLELAGLLAALGVMLSVSGERASPDAIDSAQRLVSGLVRVIGLVAAAGFWYWRFGRERLSLAAAAWLGSESGPRPAAPAATSPRRRRPS